MPLEEAAESFDQIDMNDSQKEKKTGGPAWV